MEKEKREPSGFNIVSKTISTDVTNHYMKMSMKGIKMRYFPRFLVQIYLLNLFQTQMEPKNWLCLMPISPHVSLFGYGGINKSSLFPFIL